MATITLRGMFNSNGYRSGIQAGENRRRAIEMVQSMSPSHQHYRFSFGWITFYQSEDEIPAPMPTGVVPATINTDVRPLRTRRLRSDRHPILGL